MDTGDDAAFPSTFTGLFDVRIHENSIVGTLVLDPPSLGYLVKPVVYDTMQSLNHCLAEFGITSLPEFGAKVARFSSVSRETVEQWEFFRDWIRPGRPALRKYIESLLAEKFDPMVQRNGFKRNKRQLQYIRNLDQDLQYIEIQWDRTASPYHVPVLGQFDVKVWVKKNGISPGSPQLTTRQFLDEPREGFTFYDKASIQCSLEQVCLSVDKLLRASDCHKK